MYTCRFDERYHFFISKPAWFLIIFCVSLSLSPHDSVNAAQEQARKPPDKHSNHKQQRTFTTPTPTTFHPPARNPREPESTSELRRRVTQQMDARDTVKPEEDVKTEDTGRSDTTSATTAPSSGSARKSERNRYTTEPVKKVAEDVMKSGSGSAYHHPQLHHMNNALESSSLKNTSDSDQGHNQPQGGVTKPATADHPPAMTTDHETGMRKFVEQTSPTDQGPILHESTSKSKKPAKLSVASSEPSSSVPSTPTEGRSRTSSSASSSSAPTPVPQRKGKGVKKSGTNKSQKASPVLPSAAKQVPRIVAPAATAVTAPPPPPLPQVVPDYLERKASESSLRSTDSESISSTSDKSEKEENQTSSGEKTEIESNPPLAKEPGTGQTIPLLLAQEEFILTKVKPPLEAVNAATTPLEDGDEGKREEETEKEEAVLERELEKKEKLPLLPTPWPRSKKKLRQQQRKEDKLRRKEREKEKVREKEEGEKRKEQSVQSEAQEVTNPPERQPLLPQSSEGNGEHVVPSTIVTEEAKTKKPVAISPKKAKKLELKTFSKPAKLPTRSKTAPTRVSPQSQTPPPPVTSPSPPAQLPLLITKDDAEDSDDSPELDQLAHTWAGRELDDFKDSPEPLSPSESAFSREYSEDGSSVVDQSEVILQPSHPMEAIPISALRAMRAKGSKQRKMEEEERTNAHPVSPKKISAVRKHKELEKLPPRIIRLTDKTVVPASLGPLYVPQILEPTKSSQKKSTPKVFADDISTDSTPSPEPSRVENELTVKSKSPSLPTSPHEIAATLLSKNPALKKRKVRSDQDHDGSDEADDGKYEKRTLIKEEHSGKVLWAGDGESPHKHQMGLGHRYKAPTTLSLDAEPFYPSSDYVPKVKQYRKHHHHPDSPYSHGSRLNASLGFSSEEGGMGFERKYRVREVPPPHHLSLRPPHIRHHGNTLTPSPPPYPMPSDASSLYYAEGHGRMEPNESSRYPRVPPDISPYEVSPDEYYSANPNGRRISHGIEGMPGPRSRMMRSNTMYDDQIYSGSPHQHPAAYAAAQRRERHVMSRSSPNGSRAHWDQSSSHHLTQEEEAALFHHRLEKQRFLERKYHEEQQAKMHARHSVETPPSLGHPQHRPSRSTLYATDAASNLWDLGYDNVPDAYPSTHQTDDAFLSESVHVHQLRQQLKQQILQEHMSQLSAHARRRRYSSDNELGGEILPDLPSPGPISSATGLNKAPGTAFSGMAQARAAAAASSREHDMWSDNPEVRYGLVQWNLSNPDTFGRSGIVLINKVF